MTNEQSDVLLDIFEQCGVITHAYDQKVAGCSRQAKAQASVRQALEAQYDQAKKALVDLLALGSELEVPSNLMERVALRNLPQPAIQELLAGNF